MTRLRTIAFTTVTSALMVMIVASGCGHGDNSPFAPDNLDASGDDSGYSNGGGGGGFNGGGGGGFGFGDGGTLKGCTNLCKQQRPCDAGATTSLSGTVFDPAGRVPLYNAVVYVPNAPVSPISNGVSCDRCGDVSGDPLVSTLTGADGKFKLTNVPVGSQIPVVVQIGKWRRQFKIDIPESSACKNTPIPPDRTRLPKNHTEGDIPLIALTTGGADALECFMRKIGIDDSEFSVGGGNGRVQFYYGHGFNYTSVLGDDAGAPDTYLDATKSFSSQYQGGATFPDAQPFWSDANKLKKYDMVLLSCEGTTNPDTKPQAALDAIRDYANAGGRVFASHWHRFWLDPEADDNRPTSPPRKPVFTNLGNWKDVRFDGTINVQATVETKFADGKPFPKGQAMQQWLSNVGALCPAANNCSPAGTLPIDDAKINLVSVNASTATEWTRFDYEGDQFKGSTVQYMSFNVPQASAEDQKCGRVVYSDLHVSSGSGDQPGQAWPTGCLTTELSAQEKALEFMLFDLSACIQSDKAPPNIH